MISKNDIFLLEAAMSRRIAAMPQRLRPFTTERDNLPRALLLTGPRGCGKSTFLLHHAKGRRVLHLSMDNPIVAAHPLYQLVSDIFMLGYEGVILDEIHYAARWSIHLKALYDDFPDKTLWVSDSSSLVLKSGTADLSRRYVGIRMPLMSFREYLFLETGIAYPVYHIGDTVLPVQPTSELLNHFRNYRQHGSRPFYQEGDFNAKYMAIISKVIDADIPYFLPHITDNNLRLMRAVIGTLAASSVPRIQVTSLCADWGIGAEKLYQLLFVMESVGLIRIARYPNSTKAYSVGAKMLFADPCAYHTLGADTGTEREAFVVNCFACAGYTVEAAKDDTKGDYVVSSDSLIQRPQPITIEVGGKKKSRKQANYVARDNSDMPTSNSIPFWLLAMMW